MDHHKPPTPLPSRRRLSGALSSHGKTHSPKTPPRTTPLADTTLRKKGSGFLAADLAWDSRNCVGSQIFCVCFICELRNSRLSLSSSHMGIRDDSGFAEAAPHVGTRSDLTPSQRTNIRCQTRWQRRGARWSRRGSAGGRRSSG